MNLKEMQGLRHKWWKEGIDYLRCEQDLTVNVRYSYQSVCPQFNLIVLKELENLELHGNIVPSLYDWLYAINTELLEFEAALTLENKYQEMADVAIFCALTLKLLYNYQVTNIISLKNKKREIFYGPIYSRDINIKQRLIDLLLWALQSPYIVSKIEYNKRRNDHVGSRR